MQRMPSQQLALTAGKRPLALEEYVSTVTLTATLSTDYFLCTHFHVHIILRNKQTCNQTVWHTVSKLNQYPKRSLTATAAPRGESASSK